MRSLKPSKKLCTSGKTYGAFVVDIFDEFALDPDYDAVASDADVKTFQSFFHNDPHPNARGFDVICRRFVSTILENSRFVVGSRKNPPAVTVTTTTDHVDVETSAGKHESVPVNYTTESEISLARTASSITVRTTGEAVDYLTKARNTVNYASSSVQHTDPSGMTTGSSASSYTSVSKDGYWAEGGTEESTQKLAPGMEIVIPTDQPEKLPITNTKESKHPSKPQLSGDVKTSDSDGTFDYTETQVLKQGKVSVTAQELDFIKLETSDSDMHYVYSDIKPDKTNQLLFANKPVVVPENPSISSSYEFLHIGSDVYSRFASAHIHTYKDPSQPNEKPVYTDKNGTAYYVLVEDHNQFSKLLVPRYYFPHIESPVEGMRPARYDYVQRFTLIDRDGNLFSAYCADKDTGAQENYQYRMQNISDGTYYSAEQANRIRVVANNGYWGTSSGFGSLSAVKEMMGKSGKFSEDDIERLTDGMAMIAVAEGNYGVNVQMNLYFSLHVEDDVFSIKRFWRKENVLPSAPQTGDSSYPMLVAVLLLCSTVSVFALRRRVRRS